MKYSIVRMLLSELVYKIARRLEINDEELNEILREEKVILEQRLQLSKDEKRGRGRPKKNTLSKDEDGCVGLEVELIEVNGKEYYLTSENVVLNKELKIEGILREGKII